MQTINIASILFIFVAICTSIAVFLTIDAVLLKRRDRTTLMYIASKYMQALAVGMLLISGYNNNTALIIFDNIFYFFGFGGEIYIIAGLNTNRHKLFKIVFLAAVIFATVYIIINVLMHSLITYRIFTVGLFTFFLYVYLGLVMLLTRDNSKMLVVTGGISLAFSILWGFRTYYALINLSTADILHSNLFQTPAYIGNIVFFSVLPMLFLFINKERDQQKLQEQYRQIAARNEEIRRVNEELKELNAAKDNFFKVIGHDLRSPIGQLVQLFQMIAFEYKDLSSEKLFNHIKKLEELSVRVYKLLENLLDWARSQTGSISFNPEPVSLSDLIKENIELFEEQAETKNIKIKASNLYQGTVTIDKNMINTVVRNLLSNAIKFTNSAGEIEISNQTEKDRLIVSVKDNGVGMSFSDSNRLFKLGSGLANVGTNKEKGTGLGLILCKEFVDKHNGTIWVKSEPGEGSVFSFSIPYDCSRLN